MKTKHWHFHMLNTQTIIHAEDVRKINLRGTFSPLFPLSFRSQEHLDLPHGNDCKEGSALYARQAQKFGTKAAWLL